MWSGGALAADKVGLSSPRQGLRFFALGLWGKRGWARGPAFQRLLAVMFNFVFPLSQLLLRLARVPMPMRNLTVKFEIMTGGTQIESRARDGLGRR